MENVHRRRAITLLSIFLLAACHSFGQIRFQINRMEIEQCPNTSDVITNSEDIILKLRILNGYRMILHVSAHGGDISKLSSSCFYVTYEYRGKTYQENDVHIIAPPRPEWDKETGILALPVNSNDFKLLVSLPCCPHEDDFVTFVGEIFPTLRVVYKYGNVSSPPIKWDHIEISGKTTAP